MRFKNAATPENLGYSKLRTSRARDRAIVERSWRRSADRGGGGFSFIAGSIPVLEFIEPLQPPPRKLPGKLRPAPGNPLLRSTALGLQRPGASGCVWHRPAFQGTDPDCWMVGLFRAIYRK